MDGAENVISVRSGRDAEWTTPLFIQRMLFTLLFNLKCMYV